MARFYTVGHSSRSAEAFLATLRPYGIDLVVDVRRFPGSERNPQFDADALGELIELAGDHTPAILCAEAVYWRCHRRIVADWLVAAGHSVVDVFGPDRANEHGLTRFAEVRDGRVVYPADDGRE